MTQQTIQKITSSAGAARRIERARSGDREAFAALYRDYRGEVFRFIRVRVRDPHLAEDLTSETFVRAFRAMHRYTPTGKDVGAWFTAIARNLTADHFKSSRVRREVLVGDSAGLDASVAPSVEDQVLETLRHQPLRSALAGLPPHLRATLVLQYWAGWPNRRIARTLNRPTAGAVKSLRRRALLELRATLEADAAAS